MSALSDVDATNQLVSQRMGGLSQPDSQPDSQKDSPDVPSRPSEKKRLHWKGKTCKNTPFHSHRLKHSRSRTADDCRKSGR